MTGPLLVLGVLSVVGGWLNLPASIPLGRVGLLDRWLEPVVGESTLRITHGAATEATSTLEASLIGAAVIIAVAGIALAWSMLKPERLVPKREARPEEGFERVLANKYYVDEIYDDAVVRPTLGISTSLLWHGIDQGLIDTTLVNGIGGRRGLARFVGWIGSQLQSGQVGTYAWVLVVGVLFVLGAFTIR
jgi:NADH-quinone oxidoreductase subunit L